SSAPARPTWGRCSRRWRSPHHTSPTCPAFAHNGGQECGDAEQSQDAAHDRTDHMTRHMEAPALARLDGIRHAFFTREGRVSPGLYATRNAGVGSDDAPTNVAETRGRMAAALGVPSERFLTCYQIHSPNVVVADEPWSAEARPRADAIVTQRPGLAIGVS